MTDELRTYTFTARMDGAMRELTAFRRGPGKPWTIKPSIGNRQRWISLRVTGETKDALTLVRTRAAMEISRLEKELLAPPPPAPTPDYPPTGIATIGDVLAAHEKASAEGRLHVRPKVARNYRTILVCLVAWATDSFLRGKRRADLAVIKLLSTEVLAAPGFVPEFERRYLAPARSDRLARDRRLRTAHSMLRNSRAMFEEVALRAYAGLALPDLTAFMKTSLKVPRPVVHGRLDDAAVREMALAALEMKTSNPALYVTHLCFRHLAMRDDEIFEARREWIEPRAEKVTLPGAPQTLTLADGSTVEATLPLVREVAAVMAIRVRPYWEPKRSDGEVPISPDVLAELTPLLPPRKLDHLVNAPTKTARWELIYVAHAAFVRPWTKHLTMRSYELRRWAATKVMLLHQSKEMGDLFLRHAAKSVAEKSYFTELPMPTPITLADAGLTGAESSGRSAGAPNRGSLP